VDIYGTWIPNSNRAAVNRLDTLSADDRKEKTEERTPETDSSTPHPNAPQAHPPEMKKPQPMKIAALS
jgi:hypothetical protein